MANVNGAKAQGRSLADFQELSPAEQELLKHAGNGNEYIIGDARPDQPSKENRIRGSFIRFLALGGDGGAPVHEQGVRVRGAYITEKLDLDDCKNVLPLFLRCCWFDKEVILRDAVTQTINLDGSRVDWIDGKRARVKGSVYLRHERGGEDVEEPQYRFKSESGVNLIDARISGSFECHHADFGEKRGLAVQASRAKIGGSVFLHQNFCAKGSIFFRSSVIGGNFECSGGDFSGEQHKARIAINCHGANIRGSVYFRRDDKQADGKEAGEDWQVREKKQRFNAKGQVRFIDAVVGGSFECHGASIENPEGVALYCSRLKVNGSVLIHEGFRANGGVIFRGAEIGGNFQCDGGSFEADGMDDGEAVPAISCHGAKILGSVFLRSEKGRPGRHPERPFSAKGEVRFIDASVGGSFECHGASITNPGGNALYCSRIEVNGSVILYDGFRSIGEISFRRADIKGNLEAYEATLDNDGGKALSCENAHIAGAVLFVKDDEPHKILNASGQVNFSGAEIEGDLNCDGAMICNRNDKALVCERIRVEGKVSVGAGFRAEGEVTFAGAVIDGKMGCAGGYFLNPRFRSKDECKESGYGESHYCLNALNLRGAVINGELWLGAAPEPPYDKSAFIYGSLDLRDCRVGVLSDDDNAWPKERITAGSYPANAEAPLEPRKTKRCLSRNKGQRGGLQGLIYLNGFTYSRFGDQAPLNTTARKKWLMKQPPGDLGLDPDYLGTGFKMQPFEQLVSVLRETGNNRFARKLAMFKAERRLRRHHKGHSWRLRPANWVKWLVFEKAVGYSYRWQRVLYATLTVWAVFGLFYLGMYNLGAFCQANNSKLSAVKTPSQITSAEVVCRAGDVSACEAVTEVTKPNALNPFMYSMEALLVGPRIISSYIIFPTIPRLNQDLTRPYQDWTIKLDSIDRYKPAASPLHISWRSYSITLPKDTLAYAIELEKLLGWLATALLMMVATDIIKRE